MGKIYLGSIALEKNRWAPGRVPTYLVSDYVQRAKEDGFAGIELWQYHYLSADAEEKKRLIDSDTEFIFNSYLTLKDGLTDDLRKTAEAITQLNAVALKYNFAHTDYGTGPEEIKSQKETLLRFADLLPEKTKLLCECHAYTLGEVPERMQEVFQGLDERFGAIIHLVTQQDFAKRCFDSYGDRICHIHSAYSVPEVGFQLLESNADVMKSHLQYYKSRGFDGTVTIEFVKNADSPEEYYENAKKDLAFWKAML